MTMMRRPGGDGWRLKLIAATFGAWIVSSQTAMARDDGPVGPPKTPKAVTGLFGRRSSTSGTLGYGAPGLHPGFSGFGLGYHPGYGYGGDALGTGAEGGYPYYGGPGYPQCEPVLRRLGGIAPFPYFAGPGYPSAGHPNYYGGVGPLVVEQPVVTSEGDGADYGPFSGAMPYPESAFAPFSGQGSPVAPAPANAPPAPAVAPDEPASARSLGIDSEKVVDAVRGRGLKVTKVHPGGAAEKAGLVAGDVIYSINGYATERPDHPAWIIANAAPRDVLKLSVQPAKGRDVRTITAQLGGNITR